MKNTWITQLLSSIRSTPFKRASVVVSLVAVAAGAAFISRAVLSDDTSISGIKSIHVKATTVYAAPGKKNYSAEHWIVLPDKERAESEYSSPRA